MWAFARISNKEICLFINPSLSVLQTEDSTEALRNMKPRSGERKTIVGGIFFFFKTQFELLVLAIGGKKILAY